MIEKRRMGVRREGKVKRLRDKLILEEEKVRDQSIFPCVSLNKTHEESLSGFQEE